MSYIHLEQVDPFHISLLKMREGISETINQLHKYNCLIYISSGIGFLRSGEEEIKVVTGKCYIFTEESELFSSSSQLFNVYIISWPKNETELSFLFSARLAKQLPAKVSPLWQEALSLQGRKSYSESCRFKSTVWYLLSLLTEPSEVDEMDEIIDIMRIHLSNPYTICKLAEKANMNPTSFTRAFKKKFGLSPKEFLIRERIRAAKELMVQNKGITTKEVALKVGMQDEFYFSRLFKEKVGLPPSVYMKRSEERIAIVSQMFLQDHLLALGIQPVAAPAYPSVYPTSGGVPRYLEKGLEGTQLLNAEKVFQPEEILQAQPDRILKTFLHNGENQSILLPHDHKVEHIPFQANWYEYLREIARLFGKESKVDHIEREVEILENTVRDELCPLTKRGKWAVIWVRKKEIRLYGYKDHALLDLLYQKLGFEPHHQLPKSGYQIVSVEQLAQLQCDKLLILWSHERNVWKLAQTKEWKMMKAVQANEVYFPNSEEWDPWGPLGRKKMLAEFVNTFQRSKVKSS
ncbi:helix-turn-helix domain-containing protein [Salipaludibacillus sp. HK11]|uniref:helix-turn-helix domain-containing protein n=1 Tax=Salipaludibacillus sp. HK11 TaxID=3394320 RepID=UPI0039FD37D7